MFLKMLNARVLNLSILNNIKLKYSIFHKSPNLISRSYTLRRVFFYVPADDKKKVDKSLSYKVDSIAFDIEGGVAQSEKEKARETIHYILNEGVVTKSDPEWCVRVNGVQTGDLFLSDIDAVLSAKQLPAAIALPKVDSCEELEIFSEQVWKKLSMRPENDRGPINLIILIESARAIISLPKICEKAFDLATMMPIVPTALVLGCDDLLASLGATRTSHGIEILYARQKLVLVAKAFSLQAIDILHLNVRDHKDLLRECHEGVTMGYTGKQVIHPLEIPVVQEEFTPSRSKIKWAREVIIHFRRHQETGKGAFLLNGKMIDMSTVKQAENIISAAKIAGKLDLEV